MNTSRSTKGIYLLGIMGVVLVAAIIVTVWLVMENLQPLVRQCLFRPQKPQSERNQPINLPSHPSLIWLSCPIITM